MSFERPTFAQLRDRILSDINVELAGATYSRAIPEYAIACALAAVALLLYAFLEVVARNSTPDQPESAMMTRWASFFGINALAPTPNIGVATWPATGGSTLPAGTIVRLADGTEYTVDIDDAEDGGIVTGLLTAVVPGTAGRATSGQTIVLGSPVPGVSPNGTVAPAGLTGGTDVETVRSVSSRLRRRMAQPPRGGGPGDYVTWALEVAGVTRAWEYTPYTTPATAPGSVRVLFVTDNEADPIPSSAKVAEVQAYIDARRPVTVPDFLAQAPVAAPMVLEGSIVVESGYVQATVEASATTNALAFIKAEAEPGKTINLSRLDEVISTTAGELSHALTDPTGNVVPGALELVTLVAADVNWS